MTYTLEQYRLKECSHQQYMAQFVTRDTITRVKSHFTIERLVNTEDQKNYNTIPIKEWDHCPLSANLTLLKECGDFLTPSNRVCILKEAARQAIEQAKHTLKAANPNKDKTVTITVVPYSYWIEDKEQADEYADLSAKLKKLYRRPMTLFTTNAGIRNEDRVKETKRRDIFKKALAQHKSGAPVEVEIDITHLFNDQYNAIEEKQHFSNWRLHDWSESHYPNDRIKEGYYVVINERLEGIKNDTYSCGYCNAKYSKSVAAELVTCNKCMDSEHLTTDNLPLLFLIPIKDKWKNNNRKQFSVDGDLKEQFVKSREKLAILQQRAAKKRLADAGSLAKQAAAEKAAAANKESEQLNYFYSWLIRNEIFIEPRDIIYYNHTDSIGLYWSANKIGEEEKKELDNKIQSASEPLKIDYRFR